VLLTRSRLCPRPKPGSSLHLHVLGTPPAFVLSQDQTLREELLRRAAEATRFTKSRRGPVRRSGHSHLAWWVDPGLSAGGIRPLRPHEGIRCTPRIPGRKTGFSIWHRHLAGPRRTGRATASNLDTHLDRGFGRRVRMLLSFQRPSHLFGKGSFPGRVRGRFRSRSGPVSIAPQSPRSEGRARRLH
jgi:hypothetical protein